MPASPPHWPQQLIPHQVGSSAFGAHVEGGGGAAAQLSAASCAFHKREKHHPHPHLFSFSDKIYFRTEVCTPLHHARLPQRLDLASSVGGCSCGRRVPLQAWSGPGSGPGTPPTQASPGEAHKHPWVSPQVACAAQGPHPSPHGFRDPWPRVPWDLGPTSSLSLVTFCLPDTRADWARVSSEIMSQPDRWRPWDPVRAQA